MSAEEETDSLIRAVAAAPPLAPPAVRVAAPLLATEPSRAASAEASRADPGTTLGAFQAAVEAERARSARWLAWTLATVVTVWGGTHLTIFFVTGRALAGRALALIPVLIAGCWLFLVGARRWPRILAYEWHFVALFLMPIFAWGSHLSRAASGGLVNVMSTVPGFLLFAVAAQLSFDPRTVLLTTVVGALLSGAVLIGAGAGLNELIVLVTFVLAGAIALYVPRRWRILVEHTLAAERNRVREVEVLNEELRRQVADRAGQLASALARLSEGARAPTRLAPGDVVDERYRIVRAIGAGGMGQVHEVERITDGKHLALKTLARVAHTEALARFAREAQLAAELDHPGVLSALDVGVTRSGTLYFVMPLVDGTSLREARARYGDARWALPLLAQVADALAAMHARGIVHRDLKPANVLLDGECAKVADFGLAGLTDEAPLAATREAGADAAPALTRTGAIMGTPLYMAPELASGTRDAAPAADVFSLGVVAYELLAGALPYATPPVVELLGGRVPPPPSPLSAARPDLPPELCALVDRCLAEAPEARPAAADVAAALRRVDADRVPTAPQLDRAAGAR